LLNMGGAYPNQKYTVAIIGNRITLDWTKLKGKRLCVTGVFELYKGKPEIEINDPERINN
jgi:DNA/RNA endonuclease YhcR with UshA esterase domain